MLQKGMFVFWYNVMIRVLMVVHEMNRGGIENFIMNLYRTIDRNQIQFDFVAHTNERCAFDEEIESLGGTIYHCPDYRIVNHFEYSKWWKTFLKQHNEYKIIHSHLDSSANIHLRIAKRFGLVTIAHAHNTMEGHGIRAIVKSILKIGFNNCCDYKFGCSKAACDWLFGNTPESVVVRNGIISGNYIFDNEKRKNILMDLSIDDKVVLGNVARFSHQKNHDFLVDIFNEYHKINNNSILLLIGDGELRSQIEDKVKSLNLEKDVVFTGVRSDIPDVLNAIDLFIMPSFHEGLPVSIVEAQASGLKCLLSDTITTETDISGLVEFISIEESAKTWAKKIESMLPYDREDISNRIISAGYDIETTSKWLTSFYNNVEN